MSLRFLLIPHIQEVLLTLNVAMATPMHKIWIMKVLGVQRDSNLIFLNFTQTPLPIGGQIWWVLYLVEGMGRMYIRMLSCIVHTSMEACL